MKPLKPCKTCGVARTPENSYGKPNNRPADCKQCHNKRSRRWAKENPDKVKLHRRRGRLRKKYGLTLLQFEEMFTAQNGACKLCFNPHTRRKLNVDHCHTSGKIRGLLCDKCNLAIGLIGDDVNLLERIKGYLYVTPNPVD